MLFGAQEHGGGVAVVAISWWGGGGRYLVLGWRWSLSRVGVAVVAMLCWGGGGRYLVLGWRWSLSRVGVARHARSLRTVGPPDHGARQRDCCAPRDLDVHGVGRAVDFGHHSELPGPATSGFDLWDKGGCASERVHDSEGNCVC